MTQAYYGLRFQKKYNKNNIIQLFMHLYTSKQTSTDLKKKINKNVITPLKLDGFY